MNWPNATDYNAAVQNPQLCFRDDDLRQGQVVGDLFGLPLPHSGNFADVYQILGGNGQSWAVKCFTRPVAGLRPRYHAISEHLRQTQRAFMVEFYFLDEAIRIRDQWLPLVKMRWVEGLRLNEFVRDQLLKPVLLERLAQMWVRLAQELRDAQMAHGDLQHGNVLLVPNTKSSSLALRLIDYDGLCVPALADRPSGEVGHPNYQHPRRLRDGGYDGDMDRFALLLIYTALRCLRVGGEDLWQRHDNQENLLFREEDFRQPRKSRLLCELWEISDRDCRNLVGHLLLASQGPLSVVPTLDELVDSSGIRPLSDREEARVNDLLDDGARAPLGKRDSGSVLRLRAGSVSDGGSVANASGSSRFGAAVLEVCGELARAIAADAEGATHLITIEVEGLRDDREAYRVAKTIAESALVKTAIHGCDPNWGRIVSAAGYAGVEFAEEDLSLWLGDLLLYHAGMPQPFDAGTASAYLKRERHVQLRLRFTLGSGRCTFWTCDLTREYIRLNAEYTT
ncbi:MAG: bifunctional ornithine acetyltransferase/N-acetylglutamate synthase [Gemmataceae bacterium]